MARLTVGGSGRRAVVIALASTVVLFGLLVFVVVNAPGWERVQASFFDWENFGESAPKIVAKFEVNIRLFLIAEVLILGLGLVLAVLRGLPGPVFFPVRLLATVYTDLFRALPGVLVIYVLGFGIPGLRLPRRPERPVPVGRRGAHPRVLGLRVRGVPRRHRLGASQPGGGGPISRA